ncbi:MAG TPA: ROK family protein [Bacteroidales bacterium]|nr:ROK family protein [Bacteroidales bacterium]HPJ58145.1 ROK family protein [Bacteroidales bacterium]HRW84555.1 ROK family protein [Bacteroidales bacterium]
MNQNQDDIYLGLDIGGTKCSIVAGDKSFSIRDKVVFDTDTQRGYEAILSEFQDRIRSMLGRNQKYKLKRIGISCGGPLDSKKGIIYSPPNLPGWDNVPVTRIFSEEFGVETAVQNDANACALAEWLMGSGKGTTNMIFLTFGTGMGAGLILNGHLYSGTNDLGGEVGHIRLAEKGPVGFGKEGSFEGFCSGGGIAQLAKSIVRKRLMNNQTIDFCPSAESLNSIDARSVALAALAGDSVANEIIRISAEYLGRGLAILIDILNPECIVIGSIYSRNEILFKPIIGKILEEEAIPASLKVCRIVPAALGDSIGDYAALCVAIYEDKF